MEKLENKDSMMIFHSFSFFLRNYWRNIWEIIDMGILVALERFFADEIEILVMAKILFERKPLKNHEILGISNGI